VTLSIKKDDVKDFSQFGQIPFAIDFSTSEEGGFENKSTVATPTYEKIYLIQDPDFKLPEYKSSIGSTYWRYFVGLG